MESVMSGGARWGKQDGSRGSVYYRVPTLLQGGPDQGARNLKRGKVFWNHRRSGLEEMMGQSMMIRFVHPLRHHEEK